MAATNPVESEEKIIDRWSALIAGAEGKGEQVLNRIEQVLHDVQVPKLRLSRKSLSRRKFKAPSDEITSRAYLLAENDYLGLYKMYVGVSDYGKQLSVQWYLLIEPHDWRKFQLLVSGILLVVLALGAVKFWLGLIAFFIGAFFALREYRKHRAQAGEMTRPEQMDLLDLEELSNYVTTVHHATTGSVESLMKGLNLDFSKIDTKSKGFLKIS